MVATQIILDKEILDLAAEIFSTTFGLCWDDAVDQAIEQFPALLDIAIEWDRAAAAEALGDLAIAA